MNTPFWRTLGFDIREEKKRKEKKGKEKKREEKEKEGRRRKEKEREEKRREENHEAKGSTPRKNAAPFQERRLYRPDHRAQ